MAVIGTFGQFTTARLAIYASQASLSVTGNNIANINTVGYTRQRMDLVSLYSTGQGKYANIFNTNVGYGVLTNGASQLRDPYLDIRYRNENAKLGANEEKLDALNQMASILDEVGKGTGQQEGFGVIEAQFGEFVSALEDLMDNMGAEEYDGLVRSTASTLTAYLRKAASDLQDIKDHKALELNEAVSDINRLLTNIRDLNVQIRTQSIYGDKALELRDARNVALDELSRYMHINVEYSMERIDQFTEVEKLTVTIADTRGPDGKPIKLVDGIYGGQITIPDEMAVANENANSQKIVDAMIAARKAAEADTATPYWTKADNPDKWDAYGLDDAVQKAQDAAKASVLKANPDKTEAELATEIADAQKAASDRVVKQAMVDDAVKTAQETAEALYGRYMKADGTATENWEDADKFHNYDPSAPGAAGNLYLMRVEQLVNQQGRAMDDRSSPSGKSEAVSLSDTDLCGKNVAAGADVTRSDGSALGVLQAIRETLTREGEYSSADDIARDPYATVKRGIPYYQRALDSLAQMFAEVFNGINQLPAEEVYAQNAGGQFLDANGNPLTVDGEDVTLDKMKELEGRTDQPAVDKLVKWQAALRENGQKNPGYSFYDGGVLISNRGDNDDPTGITAANISISHAWSNHAVRLLNTTRPNEVGADGTEIPHSSRNDNIQHMISVFNQQLDYYAKDVNGDAAATLPIFHGSFREVFTAISGNLADDRQATNGKVENYTISALSLDNDRLSVSGVDLNEEATSMMQFSKSYAAACRLLTTIDSMLDTLINGTAR